MIGLSYFPLSQDDLQKSIGIKQQQMIESLSSAQEYVVGMYLQACQLAHDYQYCQDYHHQIIIQSLKECKIPYRDIKKIVSYSKDDWVQDLLEVTQDIKAVLTKSSANLIRFINRSKMHFGGHHYSNLSKSQHHKATRKVLDMYKKDNFDWNEETEEYFSSTLYSNCTYLMGLTKGNGVMINKSTLVSCAHVFIDEETQKVFQIRCFANGLGQYGVVKMEGSGIFEAQDVAFGEVLYFSDDNIRQISLNTPAELKFQHFSPVKCVQLGVLFDPDEFVETFYTSEGFIQANLYTGQNDTRLVEEMGLLVHDCYGLCGTSGSPIWNSKGELLGIHNAWNSEGYNISMIVHDNDEEDSVLFEKDQCRVTKQYERRAVSVHVINILKEKWIDQKGKTFKKTQKRLSKNSAKLERL